MERIQKRKERGYLGVFNEFFIINTRRYIYTGSIAMEKIQELIKMIFTVYITSFGALNLENNCKLPYAITPVTFTKNTNTNSKINHDRQWVIL
jgi:hypothetical protein